MYDDEEIAKRKKEQLLGNMYLITELYVARQLSGTIIKTCIDDLQREVNDQNVEILCYMTSRLMTSLCNNVAADVTYKGRGEINLEFADAICQWLFKHRHSELLQSRTKFKIQDLIDDYNADWGKLLALYRARQAEDSKKVYVPKAQILTEAQAFGKGSTHKDSGSSQGIRGYMYRPKISMDKIDYKSDSASGAESG